MVRPPFGRKLIGKSGSNSPGSVVGHRSPVTDGILCPREGKRVGGYPPLHQVVGQSPCLDRWIGVAETRGFLQAAGEYGEAAKSDVGLLSQRPVDDHHTLPTKISAVCEVASLEGLELRI